MTRETLLALPPDELIKETLRLDAVATPGPWWTRWGGEPGYITTDKEVLATFPAEQADDIPRPNSLFTAHARTAARIHAEREGELRAEVERLRAALIELKDRLRVHNRDNGEMFFESDFDPVNYIENAIAPTNAVESPNTTAPQAEDMK